MNVPPASIIVFSVQTSCDDGYEARAYGHSIFTQADALEELHEMIQDALVCHFNHPIQYNILWFKRK